MASIPLSQPDISEEDIEAVTAVLRTPRLSLGPKLPEFEDAIASFVGAKHAVAVNSGTSALHLCIRALGIGEGDEVITTPFSFIASANCILYERATVKFVDIDPETYCIDPALIEAAITPKTKAILAVDIFGYLADWKALKEIADKHNLLLIEDSCEALGSVRSGTHAGMFADCGMFAFYPNKQMTTGEGGVIVTNREDIAAQARSERNQGRALDSKWLEHRTLGFNYRISDINCALGTSQLKRLPEFIEKKKQIVEWYAQELADVADKISVPQEQEGVDISWFVYVVRLADHFTAKDRDALIAHLESENIGCNAYFPAIHLQPVYTAQGYGEGDFPVTEHTADRTLALPFFTKLSREEVASVCSIIKDGLNRLPQLSS
ncbi:MAG: DegT/DnrJ/EryC1/StrS family aminotransferase [Candidatus Peribacter sp.]|jgi:perosamine synthetase|nr:DegT/DnrJ/EryC1/StrS family aminotransferase [Candidatus Peribacter sp.]MBT4393168.1 DegT/DnrJ/EryC1/StrS family aminotransferase [Candidatus Peribacter sp.]MBT4600488.1 DegT/DnrJ/EryC1/StrS family aminotransferase [Candidatus Peribacter sp.]MBT5148536.1 DegT/DnrJ/EryC1/StrS family aminotransferase [Candidatus Peribacter sp.]MBT5638703.1 DegT/DnrJ/EryC1/StrS family aminotransferase [Candidatus Peribacter sp.]